MKQTLFFAAKRLILIAGICGLQNVLTSHAMALEQKAIKPGPELPYVGKIIFTSKVQAPDPYQPMDAITTLSLNSTKNLYFHAVLEKPLASYLQELTPELSAAQASEQGNYQFTFTVDGRMVYTENLNVNAGLASDKATKKVLTKPFFSEANEDSWGRFLWMRFMHVAGEAAFTEGQHQLKLQIRPYVKTSEVKVGTVIAEGAVAIDVVKPIATEQQIAIQPIAAIEDWLLSKERYQQDLIRAMNKKIAQKDFKDISAVVVIKNNALLLEEYFNGSDRSSLHDPRSVGKSFASTLLGIAIGEGFIQSKDQTLKEFYPLTKYQNYSAQKAGVTLQDLITMSSGFEGDDANSASVGNEENMYPTADWVKFALDLPMRSPQSATKQWSYFTAGVVLLGDILQKTVPQGLEKYADNKLFAPLGIHDYQWQYTPQHVANTAGGLRLRALDFAKYGQLYQNGGKWGNAQIIPKDWVEASLSKQIARAADSDGGYYGYLFWHDNIQVGDQSFEVAYATGNGGNKIYIFKDIPLVVVITAKAYNKAYAHPQAAQMLRDYILPAILTE